jgi:hypothetical protein
MPTALIPNPPWVTEVIAAHFPAIMDSVPAEWQPLMEDAHATRKGLVVEIPEYGCGVYGCVMPTDDPHVVLKITTDESEAEFAQKLLPRIRPEPAGFVRYLKIIKLGKHKINGQQRPVYAVWREEADDVGELADVSSIPRRDRKHTGDLIFQQKGAATEAFFMMHKHKGIFEKALKMRDKAILRVETPDIMDDDEPWTDMAALSDKAEALALLLAYHEAKCQRLAADKVAPEIGRALLTCLMNGYLVSDVHEGNIGRVKRNGESIWVITDPGNVAVLPDPWIPWERKRGGTEPIPNPAYKPPGGVEAELDMELVERMRAHPENFQRGARNIQAIADEIVAERRGFGRKAFICDVAEAMATTTARLAPTLLAYQNLGWLQMSRADLVGAMDPKKVAASTIHSAGSEFQFILSGHKIR